MVVVTAEEEQFELLVMQLRVLVILVQVLEKLEQPEIDCFEYHLGLQRWNQPVR